MRFAAFAVGTAVAVASALVPGSAQAEPSAWLALGGGYGLQQNGAANYEGRATAFSWSLGVGSTAEKPFVVGGIMRMTTYFTLGTDLGLAARFATRGFVRGDWGLALDAGVAARWWKSQAYGHFPIQAVVTGGLPWGFQVGVGADVWDVSGDTPTARGGFAVLEFDFLRFTVMRGGSTASFWPNPAAADAVHTPQ